ncbi:MBL fold metallo-hydrolase [Catellatospora sichuanensis]|uniref:MBL fold metallo-hydrolase n=1 Tax=Catellatospora sichuanensis TaxID=1969805 RepID=UPI0011837B69|nr:MBL fold metallo-hydrolase [Catellatospora sichuanensis]
MSSTTWPVVEPTPSLTRLAPDVYAYLQPDGGWCVSNAGVLLGEDAVTLVDATATERRARLLAEHIAALTWAPVRTLVVTHRHGDHHSELQGAERGAELDDYAILADVAAFNEGRIPTCFA